MLTINILIITLFIKSYSFSITKSQIESISEEIESYFTIPTNNSYNISFSNIDVIVTNIYPVIHYDKKILIDETPMKITYVNLTVTHIFDIIVYSKLPYFSFRRKNICVHIFYRTLPLQSKNGYTFDYYKPIFGKVTYSLGDLAQFDIFKDITQNGKFQTLFLGEWENHMDMTLINYPKSRAQILFEQLIQKIINTPRIPMNSALCKEKIDFATISVIDFDSTSKVGISYRQFNDVLMKLSYKTKEEEFKIFNVKVSFILIANDYYKFGKFKDTNECVISITKEIFNKMFKAVLNEM